VKEVRRPVRNLIKQENLKLQELIVRRLLKDQEEVHLVEQG